jgi:hypothetical protein
LSQRHFPQERVLSCSCCCASWARLRPLMRTFCSGTCSSRGAQWNWKGRRSSSSATSCGACAASGRSCRRS